MKKFYLVIISLITIMSLNAQGVLDGQPAGELTSYKRAGKYFVVGNNVGELEQGSQDGFATELIVSGSNAYLLNPISIIADEHYVRGSIKGNKLILPVNQSVLFINEEINGRKIVAAGKIAMMKKYVTTKGTTYIVDESANNVIYTINKETIKLDGTDENGERILGIYYVVDGKKVWYGVGEAMSEYTKITPSITKMPKSEIYTLNGLFRGQDVKPRFIKVARLGDDLYLQNITAKCKLGIVKGTKSSTNENEFIFKTGQFMGGHLTLCYFEGLIEGNEFKTQDVIFVYDPNTDTYTMKDGYIMFTKKPNDANNYPIDGYTYCSFKGKKTAGIAKTINSSLEQNIEYFDISGRRIEKPTVNRGVTIVKKKTSDGHITVSKLLF